MNLPSRDRITVALAAEIDRQLGHGASGRLGLDIDALARALETALSEPRGDADEGHTPDELNSSNDI